MKTVYVFPDTDLGLEKSARWALEDSLYGHRKRDVSEVKFETSNVKVFFSKVMNNG
jgi:hypothetical protein